MPRRGFTLLELLVVTVIISALIAILLPSLGNARQTAKRVACGAGLHNLSIGIKAYLLDHSDTYPASAQMPSVNITSEPLPVTLKSYVTAPRAWRCPADTDSYVRTSDGQTFDSYFAGETLSFDYNMGLGGRRIQTAFLYSILHEAGTYVLQDFDNFHDKKIPLCKNILYADSHVGTVDDILQALGSAPPAHEEREMEIRTKNRIGAAGFGVLAMGLIAWFSAAHWPEEWSFSTPKGTPVSKALKADLTDLDDEKMVAFITDLQFKGSTHEQRLALALKLKTHFDAMPVLQRLALMLRMRKVFENDPNSELVKNSSAIMQDFWNQQVKDYMSATPEERKKMLDARIDEQVAMENMEKLQNGARSLLGLKPEKPSEPGLDPMMRDIEKFRGFLANAITDSFANTPPRERAGASQFFLDMRARRLERGLAVAF